MRLLVALLALHAVLSLGFHVATVAPWLLERGARPRLDRQRVGWFFREWGALLVVLPLRLASLWQPAPRSTAWLDVEPHRAVDAPPVLLVPGYAMNRSCFWFLALYLRRRGWRWVWPVNAGPWSSPIPVQAARLAERVAELKAATGAAQVDLVGHSMGGLICAWYLQELGGAAHVRRLVTLGTPWRGTRIAVFGLRREARDLLPGSEIVQGLGPPAVPTTALWSPDDTIVLPPAHARRDALPGVELPGIGHLSLLMSATVYRLVARTLRGDAERSEVPAELPAEVPAEEPAGPQGDRDASLAVDA